MKKLLKIVEVYDLPDNPDDEKVYVLLPKNFSQSYYKERTNRNIGWITNDEQEILRNSVVGVAGCGGMGGLVATTLLRLGVGEIRIADTEVFDVSNINRQFAANKKTIGKSKAFETAKMLRDISDDTKIVVYPQGINEETVECFVSDCDVILDEVEFWAIGARCLLHVYGRELGISLFTCSTVGFGSRLFFFPPNGMPIEQLLGISLSEALVAEQKIRTTQADKALTQRIMEQILNGLIPEIPDYFVGNRQAVLEKLLNEGRASIVATNPSLAAGFVADRVLLFLLQRSNTCRTLQSLIPAPGYLYLDVATMTAKVFSGDK